MKLQVKVLGVTPQAITAELSVEGLAPATVRFNPRSMGGGKKSETSVIASIPQVFQDKGLATSVSLNRADCVVGKVFEIESVRGTRTSGVGISHSRKTSATLMSEVVDGKYSLYTLDREGHKTSIYSTNDKALVRASVIADAYNAHKLAVEAWLAAESARKSALANAEHALDAMKALGLKADLDLSGLKTAMPAPIFKMPE